MAVSVTTLDILTQRAHFDSEVARAIGDAIHMENTHLLESVATKQDLGELGNELRHDIALVRLEMAHLRSEMLRWMFAMNAGFATLVLGGVYFMLESMLSRLQQ